MKVITDYFSSPRSTQPSPKAKSVTNGKKSQESDEEDSEKAYYGLRKIKIRLANPNVPDSYICEVYDSSPEDTSEEDLPIGELARSTKKKEASATTPDNRESKKLTISGSQKEAKKAPKDKVLAEKNQTLPEPKNSPTASVESGRSPRIRKPAKTAVLTGKTEMEPTKKRPRPIKEPSAKGSILNYFAKPVPKTESPGKKVNSDMDCVVLLDKINPNFLPPPKKPKIDPEVLKARKAFLQSGIPGIVKRAAVKIQTCPEASYWAVSHVQQRGEEKVWESRNLDLNLKADEIYHDVNNRVFRWPCASQSAHVFSETKTKKINKKALEKLKVIYKQVPVESMYNNLKELSNQYEGSDILWPDKYRPGTKGVLGNDSKVESLKDWLKKWKEDGGFQRAKGDADSSDDEAFELQTACLLAGPVASGKTALVYALASELEMNVIEINASSKRSGKKLLADLQEATRSHEVREENGSALILVDDVDIVFEEDEGFLSSLQSLIATTKRPVVMSTNDKSVRHLDRFRGKLLEITMDRPHSSTACAMLELICHLEEACPPRSSILRLLQSNKVDIRRSLLEIQLWNGRSGWEIPRHDNISATDTWWASHQFLFGQPLLDELEAKKTEETKTKNESLSQFKDLTCFFDALSYSDMITKEYAPDLSWSRFRTRDSLSLSEDFQVYNRRAQELSQAVSSEILRIACPVGSNIEQGTSSSVNRWIESRLHATEELVPPIPNGAGKAAPMDYLPTLRTILREELSQATSASNRRRSRGLYHLRSLMIERCAVSSEILTNIFHSYKPTLRQKGFEDL